MKKTTIKQYVRNKKGHPIGVLIAVDTSTGIDFGWSLCHNNDQFSKEKGTLIATNRANSLKNAVLPETLTGIMASFVSKANRYFYPLTLVQTY